MSRLRRMPQTAGRRISTQFHRIPQKVRFFLLTSLFALLTTLFVSHYPVSILPQYRVGDVAEYDIVAPADMVVKEEEDANGLAAQFKRSPVLLHAGEKVTEEKLPLVEAVRKFRRWVGVLAMVNDENNGTVSVDENGGEVFAAAFDEREKERLDAALSFSRDVLRAAGATQVCWTGIASTHVQGTCRMGSDPERSVVDARARVIAE